MNFMKGVSYGALNALSHSWRRLLWNSPTAVYLALVAASQNPDRAVHLVLPGFYILLTSQQDGFKIPIRNLPEFLSIESSRIVSSVCTARTGESL